MKPLLTMDYDCDGEPVETDYTLEEGDNDVWITVRDFSVMLRQTNSGLNIEAYPEGSEDENPIGSLFVHWLDATRQDESEPQERGSMTKNKALTWNELANLYDEGHPGGRPARTLRMETVFAWVKKQTDRIYFDPVEEMLHLLDAEGEFDHE